MPKSAHCKKKIPKQPKHYPIRGQGVWSVWGLLSSSEHVCDSTAKEVLENGFHEMYPSKKTGRWAFLSECMYVYGNSNFLRSFRPKAIVGANGSWVAIGPMDDRMFYRIKAENEWDDLAWHLFSVFGMMGHLMHVKAVVHIDRSKTVLDWSKIPQSLPYFSEGSDSESEGPTPDFDDCSPSPTKNSTTVEDLEHESVPEEDQQLITDFFRPKTQVHTK